MAVLTFVLARGYLVDQREGVATRQSFVGARLVRDLLLTAEPDVAGLLSSLRPDSRSEVGVAVGEQWYSTSVAVTPESVPADLNELAAAGSAGVRWTRVETKPALVVVVPIPAVGATYAEIFSLDELDDTLGSLRVALAIAAIVAAFGGAVFGLTASRRALRPVRDVARTAAGITAGQLDRRLDVLGDPDLEPLATSFNRMVDALQDRIRREARFSSDVSHELRTPLAAITAAMSIARRRRSGLPDELRDVVDVLDDQIGAFETLTTDLLEIARVDAGSASLNLDQADPAELVRRSVADLAEAPPVEVIGSPKTVRVDKRRVRQVVANLVTNAERYADGVDKIEVADADTSVQIRVHDRGPGVAPDERETIFDRFTRGRAAATPASPRGSGLGLALAREHVELHGGRIWVEDRVGGGSTFIVELPTMDTPR
jgi:signal transduction histidine kinase